MQRMMELDLRALKLEIQHLGLEPGQVEKLTHRIDLLIQRVEQAGKDTPQIDKGESI